MIIVALTPKGSRPQNKDVQKVGLKPFCNILFIIIIIKYSEENVFWLIFRMN